MRETGLDKDGKRVSISKTCFHCKSMITLNRYDDNDVIYFDGNFYHKQCFMDMKSIKKKCGYCKEDIIINSSNNHDLIYYDKKYYHEKCFIEKCTKMTTPKWKTALSYMEKYNMEAQQEIEKILSVKNASSRDMENYEDITKNEIQKIWDESDLNHYLIETYNVHSVANVYTRHLLPIYKGTYYKAPGLIIPPSELLDMWKRKLTYLNKAREKKIRSGADMNGMQKIAYDLAILINKYDSYLEWKEQQQVLESKQIDIQKNILKNVDLQNVGKQINKKKENNREDIDILLEEMF